ncbi:MAG TPA: hypothetical protein H9727_04250 [Candidatus Borkfalkia avistercoris]|uniref:Uncharacterized protein n=1 Tax=Candidatus Borkfalkia avistercoris TaxID=2838504 RepID=A0A9D2CZ79_9FIRM|nr:hypothetical protein [Candidatus Borkfalkia avistercoris]
MTIHHDKLAYGKLSSLREELSEDRLIEMAKALSGQEDGGKKEEKGKDGSVSPRKTSK